MVKKTQKIKTKKQKKSAIKKRSVLFLSPKLIGFGGVVAMLAVATVAVFLSYLLSVKFALLFGALSLLGLGVVYEFSSRRKWEAGLIKRLNDITVERERLSRNVASIRDGLNDMRQILIDAGEEATRIRKADMAMRRRVNLTRTVEERMLKTLTDQLQSLKDMADHAQVEMPQLTASPDIKNMQVKNKKQAHVLRAVSENNITPLIQRAVQKDQIDVLIQPIVTVPQRKLRFYELLSRVPDGTDQGISATQYVSVARVQGLQSSIDNLVLLKILHLVKSIGAQETTFDRAFFCNIAPETLKDTKFMSDLAEFVARHKRLAKYFVFEMTEKSYQMMDAEMRSVLAGLSGLGCRFSMDGVREIPVNAKMVLKYGVRFLKLDKALILNHMSEAGGLRRLRHLKSDLDKNGIDLIVEKIETEKELVELLDVEIDYGQGFLFGEPEIYGQPLALGQNDSLAS